jgi:hypothetical protein
MEMANNLELSNCLPTSETVGLGAESVAETHAPGLDPIVLAALGSELISRLRSTTINFSRQVVPV